MCSSPPEARQLPLLLRRRRCSFGAGLNVVVGAERHRQDQPARGRLVRAARQLAAHAPRGEAHHLGRAASRAWSWSSATAPRALQAVEVAYAPGQGKRARWNGVEVASQDDLRGRMPGVHLRAREPAAGQGQPGAAARPPGRLRRRARPPVRRRRARPAVGAAPAQRAAAGRQARRRRAHALDPWDAQFARAAAALGRRRRDLVAELPGASPPPPPRWLRPAAASPCSSSASSPRVDYDEAALLRRAARPARRARRRAASRSSGLTATTCGSSRCGGQRWRRASGPGAIQADNGRRAAAGSVRGSAGRPARCAAGGAAARRPRPAPLRLAGRAARRRAGAAARGAAARGGAHRRAGHALSGRRDERARRRSPPAPGAALAAAGQAIITTTEPALLHRARSSPSATVIELPLDGSVAAGARCDADTAGPAPPPDACAAARGWPTAARDRAAHRAPRRRPERGARPPGHERPGARLRGLGARRRRAGGERRPPARLLPRRCSPSSARRLCGPTSSPTWAARSCRRMDELAPGHPVKRFRFVVERAGREQDEERSRRRRAKRPREARAARSRRRAEHRRRECATSGSGRPSRPPADLYGRALGVSRRRHRSPVDKIPPICGTFVTASGSP